MSEVILRKIKASDTDNIVRWRNSDSVKRNLFTQSELTAEQHLGWLKSKVETGSCAQYIIVVSENSTNTDIGTVFIKNIDRQSNKVNLVFLLVKLMHVGRDMRSLQQLKS
jgi:RimJ/RimL family protein N-acetyltransferase